MQRFALRHPSDIIVELAQQFELDDVLGAYEEIVSLVTEGALFCDEGQVMGVGDTVSPPLWLSGICLHVAHDCNMRCSYCFAGSGLYGGKPALMQLETARASLDYLFTHAGQSAHVYVDFFGGEPTLNLSVVKDAICYGNQLAKESGRSVTFSMTTNGLDLDKETMNYLNEQEVNVIISMDGRPQVHDAMRSNRQGQGTYEAVCKNASELYKSRYSTMANRYGDGVYTYVGADD